MFHIIISQIIAEKICDMTFRDFCFCFIVFFWFLIFLLNFGPSHLVTFELLYSFKVWWCIILPPLYYYEELVAINYNFKEVKKEWGGTWESIHSNQQLSKIEIQIYYIEKRLNAYKEFKNHFNEIKKYNMWFISGKYGKDLSTGIHSDEDWFNYKIFIYILFLRYFTPRKYDKDFSTLMYCIDENWFDYKIFIYTLLLRYFNMLKKEHILKKKLVFWEHLFDDKN